MNDDVQQYITEYTNILNKLNEAGMHLDPLNFSSGSAELQFMAAKQYIIKNKIPQLVDDDRNSLHIIYYDNEGHPSEPHILHLPLIESMSELMQDGVFRSSIEKLIKRKLECK